LLNLSATHSFISVKLVETLGLIPTQKSSLLFVIVLDRKTVTCEELYEGCPIRMYECEFLADLYRFGLTDFGFILKMDWLAEYQAQIDCLRSKITLKGLNREKVVHKSQRPRIGVKLVSVMKTSTLLGKGSEEFLCHIVKSEGAKSSLEDIAVVREFSDVFPNEISGIPPLREVEFCIDLIYGATPISRAPYQMAPAELKELKT